MYARFEKNGNRGSRAGKPIRKTGGNGMPDSTGCQSGTKGILEGVRILDFSQMKTGPMGTQLLGDLGADVIKIERIDEGDWERRFPAFGRFTETGASSFFLAMNRNKRSLAIDLKAPEARRILYTLAATADVVVQNFRPGVLDKLGFGYRDFARIRPDIIYCSNSGYGQTGPYRTRPGQDLLAQATSGMIMMNGTDDQPVPVATTVADGVTSMILALAILGALFHRQRTGEGQEVDVDLMSSLIALQQEEVSAFLNLHPRPDFQRSRTGIPAPWLSAPYGIYRTQDDRYLAIAMTPLDKLGNLIGLPELERYSGTREAFDFRDEVRALIQERIVTRPRDEWLRDLLAADIWCAPVHGFEEMVSDPQVRHNQLIRRMSHPKWGDFDVVAAPVRYSRTPATYRFAPPAVGEHTREILREAGFSELEIEGWIRRKVVSSCEM